MIPEEILSSQGTMQYKIEREPFDSYLLILTLDGSGTIVTPNGTQLCSRFDVALIDCNQLHSYYANEHWEFLWLHFNGNSARELSSVILEKHGNVAHAEGTLLLGRYFPHLVEHEFGASLTEEITISSYIHRLLADFLSSAISNKKNKQQATIVEAQNTF